MPAIEFKTTVFCADLNKGREIVTKLQKAMEDEHAAITDSEGPDTPTLLIGENRYE
jgi:hypothetical protein